MVELAVTSEQLLTEAVMECESMESIDAHRFLCRDAEGVWYVDEAAENPQFLGVHEAMAAAVMGESILMVLDGESFLFDGTDMLPIAIPTPVPIETVESLGESVWLMGAGRLFRYANGRVSELSVDGHPTIFDVAVAADRVHLAVPEIISLDASADPPIVVGQIDAAADSMAVDANGHLWFIADSRLFVQREDDAPVEIAMPEPVHTVVGPTVWIEGETEAFRYRDGGLLAYPLVAEGMVGVDEYGRMLQVREGSFRRHSRDRPVVVVGLPDSVTVATTVRLLPSDPGSVDALRVWVDAAEVPVAGPPYTITIDPEMLNPGEHTLRLYTESDRGDALSERGVWIGELGDVGWDQVAGISEKHCLHCHGGQTLTVLSGPTEWAQHVDAIIEVVTMQDMPLGGPYLTDDEITTIRAWKHGGFQP